jgi:hypothetical protein
VKPSAQLLAQMFSPCECRCAAQDCVTYLSIGPSIAMSPNTSLVSGRSECLSGPGNTVPDRPGPSSGMQKRGARKDKPVETPPDKAQRNFTDGDSRIMPSQGGFIAGYNGQIAVDAAYQIIVAQRLATNPADFAGLIPLVDQAHANLGRKLREVSGDTGFATEANLEAMAERRVRAYLSTGRIRHGETDPAAGRVLKRKPRMQAMADTICTAGRRSRYRLRKQVVEPVFGHIKQARGFRQFLLRGLDKVKAEWAMLRTVHNLPSCIERQRDEDPLRPSKIWGHSGGSPKRSAGPTLRDRNVPFQGSVHGRGSDLQHQMRAVKCAPRGDQRICCWALMRRCNSHCTVLSVIAVDIGSSHRRAFA